ncbi:hypothetical protein GC163_03100 [bacterium]|nr:hypothetical protein [bacterium]
MRLLVCHTCWSWVAPQAGNCPECLHPLDPHVPDPPLERLQQTFGDYLLRLSEVRWERVQTPNRGTLLSTTQGLMFLPFLVTNPDGSCMALQDESRWSVWRFWHGQHRARFPVLPQAADAPFDVVQQFLDSPGALFLPRRHIVRFHTRARQWSFVRALGGVVRMAPLSPQEEWQPAWRQLMAQQAEWQTLITL